MSSQLQTQQCPPPPPACRPLPLPPPSCAALHVELRQGDGWELSQFLCAGEVRRTADRLALTGWLKFACCCRQLRVRCARQPLAPLLRRRPHTFLQSGVIGGNTRLFMDGQQASTTHTVSEAAGEEVPAAGGAKRPLAASPGGSAGPSSSGDGDAAKRQRRASDGAVPSSGGVAAAAAAAAAGGATAAQQQQQQQGSDPLDRVPDAPMHLMRVRGIPR